MVTALSVAAGQELRFEAEDWSSPKTAWVKDKQVAGKWMLWTTDRNAGNWSGRVVLRCPGTLQDRPSPGAGAPMLETRIRGIPDGAYDVYVKGGFALGISLDGQTWIRCISTQRVGESVQVRGGELRLWVDDRFAFKPGVAKPCYYDCVILRPRVRGWATERRAPAMDRGVVAVRTQSGIAVLWRLLSEDSANAAFHVFRRVDAGPPQRLTRTPVARTTFLLDPDLPSAGRIEYQIARSDGAAAASKWAAASPHQAHDVPYVRIPLQGPYRSAKLGVGDLDGDGAYDYVVKQPGGSIAPYKKYWKRSKDTYKIEAYLSNGRFLWRRDLGWSIEAGIWYSPFVVADLTGDGRAEVAVKTGAGDPRDADGRVRTGAEWLSIWDGMTGREIARTPWPGRSGHTDYNRASRNQLAVAYLDGKTPCVVALRGTYGLMKAEAYQLRHGQLLPLWRYCSEDCGPLYWGQGAHSTNVLDLDGDGRDEIVMGACCLDDNGAPLWCVGRGHNNFQYIGDIDPRRSGWEIFYGFEHRKTVGGAAVVDARTGQVMWQIDVPAAGAYRLAVRYCCTSDARRGLAVDGRALPEQVFAATGGFGNANPLDWVHHVAQHDGQALRLELEAGSHQVRLENTNGTPLNIDYVALVPVKGKP